MNPCFCHFNGYEVKDAFARRTIEEMKKLFPQLQTTIIEENKNQAITFWLGTFEEYEQVLEKKKNCFYIVTDDNSIQNQIDELLKSINENTLSIEGLNALFNDISAQVEGVSAQVEDILSSSYETGISNKKIVPLANGLYKGLTMSGNKNGLSFNSMFNFGTAPSVQGLSIDTRTGEYFYNNNTEIYKISEKGEKTVLFSGDLGHGGDMCFIPPYAFICDGDNNRIHKVNIDTGVKEAVYQIDTAAITNTNSTGTARADGICFKGPSPDEFYIIAIDNQPDYSQIPVEDTIRIYEYNLTTGAANMIYSQPKNTIFIQGFTCDNDNLYFCGNKIIVDGVYTGNELTILRRSDLSLIDVISNNDNCEFEGLDYGYCNGFEGIHCIFACSGRFGYVGCLSFNGGLETIEYISETSKRVFYKNRNLITCQFKIDRDFNAAESIEMTNFLPWPIRSHPDIPFSFMALGETRDKFIPCEITGRSLIAYPVVYCSTLKGTITFNI